MGNVLLYEPVPAVVLIVVAQVADEGVGVESLVDRFALDAEGARHLARRDAVARADELVHGASERVGSVLAHFNPPCRLLACLWGTSLLSAKNV